MIGGKNIHSRKIIEPEVEKIVEKVDVEIPQVEEPVLQPVTEKDFYEMIKSEQIDLLKKFGLNLKEIKKLKHEKDRVNKILELNGE